MRLKYISWFVFILVCFSFISVAYAAGLDSAEKAIQTADKILSRSDYRAEFLKQQWANILNKTVFGKVLLSVNSFLTNLSPVFNFVLGIPYSFSWTFFVTFALWFFFVGFFWRLSYVISFYFLIFIWVIFKGSLERLTKIYENPRLFKIINFALFFLIILIFSKLKLPFIISKVITGLFGDASWEMKFVYAFFLVIFYFIWRLVYLPLRAMSIEFTRYLEKHKKLKEEVKKEVKESLKSAKESVQDHIEQQSSMTENQSYASAYLEELGKRLRESSEED